MWKSKSNILIITGIITVSAFGISKFKEINTIKLLTKKALEVTDTQFVQPINNTNEKISISTYKTTENYNIEVQDLTKLKLKRETIENNKYLTIDAVAKIIVKEPNNNVELELDTNVVFHKKGKEYIPVSNGNIQEKISKRLLQTKKVSNENIKDSFSDFSLLYLFPNTDIQINYPESFNYIANETTEESKSNILTLYPNAEDQLNYIKIHFNKENNNQHKNIISDYISQGYINKENISTQSGLKFSIVTNNFTKNNSLFTETIYISKDNYKNVSTITITTHMNEEYLKIYKEDINFIINSLL